MESQRDAPNIEQGSVPIDGPDLRCAEFLGDVLRGGVARIDVCQKTSGARLSDDILPHQQASIISATSDRRTPDLFARTQA